jgi:hypothetical protein
LARADEGKDTSLKLLVFLSWFGFVKTLRATPFPFGPTYPRFRGDDSGEARARDRHAAPAAFHLLFKQPGAFISSATEAN